MRALCTLGAALLASLLTSCCIFHDSLAGLAEMCGQATLVVTTTEELLTTPEGWEREQLCLRPSPPPPAAAEPCTLRAALNTAATCGGTRTVALAADARYVLTAAGPPPALIRRLEATQERRVGKAGLARIVGTVTIEGNGAVLERGAGAPPFRFFHVTRGGDLTLRRLELRQGVAVRDDADPASPAWAHFGGAVFNEGRFTARNVRFEGNQAPAPQGQGGALANFGTADIASSTFARNAAGSTGSAIHQERGWLNLAKTTLAQNGLAGSAVLGVLRNQSGSIRIDQSTFSSNLGDIAGIATFGGSLEIARSTFQGQAGLSQGALYCSGGEARVSFQDVTIAGNSAAGGGGGGGGVRARSGCQVVFGNTIVALNLPVDCSFAARPSLLGSNLASAGDATCGFPHMADPDLLPLGDYGGETATMLPRAGSPAVNAGGSECRRMDQRDQPRPVPLPGSCDIGAVERRITDRK